MRKLIILLSSILLTGSVFAKSTSLVTQSGYSTSHGHGHSSDYSHTNPGQEVKRYLYAAFQKGSAEGNMRSNPVGSNFEFDPRLSTYHLAMTRPGFSQLDVYFHKDSRYTVRTASLSILERLYGMQAGMISIDVNGRNVISRHSAVSPHRFMESTWPIAHYLRDGQNHIKIHLQGNGGWYSLLGVKVETREVYTGQSDQHEYSRFVRRAFQRFHYRQPTDYELRYYVNLLRKGYTRSEVRELIRTLNQSDPGDDYYTRLVDEYFQRVLNRPPTAQQRRYYSNRLRSGSMTLAQFNQELERLKVQNPQQIEQRVRNTFYQYLNRYPTAHELRYYADAIRSKRLTWVKFEEEVRLLSGNHGMGPGLGYQEIQQFGFTSAELNWQFWNRFEQTQKDGIRMLIQRCNYVITHETSDERKKVAGQIRMRIQTKFPDLF